MAKKEPDEREREKLERFEAVKTQMAKQGYACTERTISVLRANVMAFVTAGPAAVLMNILYVVVWGEMSISWTAIGYLIWFALFLLTIPIHEGLHGLGWHWFTEDGWGSIHFGMMWKYLTPYCHCAQPLKMRYYLVGVLLPFAVLGLGLSLIGIATHHAPTLQLGALGMLAAGGDTTIAWMLRKHRGCLIYDHPSECGFIVFR